MEMEKTFLDEIQQIYGESSKEIVKAFEFANKKH